MAAAEHRGRVMASDLHLIVVPPTGDAAGDAPAHATSELVQDAVAYLDHLEQCWSRFIPTSDISTINALGASGGGRTSVDSSTVALLAVMVEGYQATAGRFDPTVLRAVVAEGYAASHVDPDRVTVLADVDASWTATIHDVDIDLAANTVVVPAGLTLDPGGIGKGLAADLTVARLLAAGAAGALVGIGGDLATGGAAVDDAGWLVQVERPDRADGLLCTLAISGGGVATSSTRSRRWVRDGVERHHQIDPRTERCSTTDLVAVTVIAPMGWLAEVHATAALGTGSADAMAYLEGHGLSGIAFGNGESSAPVLTTADLAGIDMMTRNGAR